MSEDTKTFGQMVRQRRKAMGWSGEYLAGQALGNIDRKGMISQIENGKIPNITRETVRKVAEVLFIDVEDIPASLRWSEAAAVVKDTNTVVHELQAASEESQTTNELVLANTQKLLELIARQGGTKDFDHKERLVIALARRYAEGSHNDFDAAYAGLERALHVAVQDRERGKLPSNTDDAINAVIARVDALNDGGKIDTAAALLAEEEARTQAGLLRLYDKGIAQAILTRDVDAAVSYELKKLPLEFETSSEDDNYAYLRSIFIAWYTRGDEQGLNFDAEVAIAIMRNMAQRFANDQDKKGACLTNLGTALWMLGRRESSTGRLADAVAAHRSALELRTRGRGPLEWALVQMNLGNALWALGEREIGIERLTEAAAAFRSALEVRTRDHFPLEWANSQVGLGNVLAAIAERESGTGRLKEAAAAYRNALGESTHERAPLNWATTQMNLGNVLCLLGKREHETIRFQEAIAAHRNALEVSTRDRVPLNWAKTQMNLGNALQCLGEREGSTVRLQEAVVAYRNALEEFTRDRVPMDWAKTIGNEGEALMVMADRTGNTVLARRALDQIRDAERVLREGGHSNWASKFAKSIPRAEEVITRLLGTKGQ